jgi:hypothetical protein
MPSLTNAHGLRLVSGGVATKPLRSPISFELAPVPPAARQASESSNRPLWPPDKVNLRIPDPLATRIAKAVAASGFKWAPEIKVGDDRDIAVIQRIYSDNPKHHVELLNFDEGCSQYPPWYLSSLCVRAYVKSQLAQCAGAPSMVVLLPSRMWFGNFDFERQSCVKAGLIRQLTLDVLGDWDESTINEKVQDWTSDLRSLPASPALSRQVDNRVAVLEPKRATPSPHNFVYMFSPGDTEDERTEVEKFFTEVNSTYLQKGVQFHPLPWKSFVDSDLGDQQKLVFKALIRPEFQPVVCAIFILKHRLGGGPGRVSGTLQEWERVLKLRGTNPDLKVKLFYSEEEFITPPPRTDEEAKAATAAFEQFMAVQNFREKQKIEHPGIVESFKKGKFADVLRSDLSKWLNDLRHPWNSGNQQPRSSDLGFDSTPQR